MKALEQTDPLAPPPTSHLKVASKIKHTENGKKVPILVVTPKCAMLAQLLVLQGVIFWQDPDGWLPNGSGNELWC